MKKIFFKISLSIFVFIFTSCLLLVATNFYLKFAKVGKSPLYSGWMIEAMDYTPQIIFWSKSWCQLFPEYCHNPEEKILPLPVAKFPGPDENSDQTCQKILFLGDSFTEAPWTAPSQTFSSVFSQSLAEESHSCIVSYRLATGGVNNFQEIKVFLQTVKLLKPDVVIWQFYWNDEYENSERPLFVERNQKLESQQGWKSMVFLAGYLNQRIPFLKGSTLGKHLMYLGETTDPFHYWLISPTEEDGDKKVYDYNQKMIPQLLNLMSEVSKTDHFRWYTTLAPLESQVVANENVTQDVSAPIFEDAIRKLLQDNSTFISMENVQNPMATQSANVLGLSSVTDSLQLFNTTDDENPVGERHLSPVGNQYFGQILYTNFKDL